MNITIISGSTRTQSASLNVSKFISQHLSTISDDIRASILDLASANLPMWDEDTDVAKYKNVHSALNDSDAFVFVVPEWHGMAPPAVKNLFFLFTDVYRHKPAFLVSVSAGTGGRYPILDMRSTTYKNSCLNYIPVNSVIDKVNAAFDQNGQYIAEKPFIQNRLDEGLRLLFEYGKAFQTIRKSDIVTEHRFPNGI